MVVCLLLWRCDELTTCPGCKPALTRRQLERAPVPSMALSAGEVTVENTIYISEQSSTLLYCIVSMLRTITTLVCSKKKEKIVVFIYFFSLCKSIKY